MIKLKLFRDILRSFWKEQAPYKIKHRPKLLIYDEYLNRYVSEDELLIPGEKTDVKSPTLQKKSNETRVFDLLLKKFVNPKLDLLSPGLKNLDQLSQFHSTSSYKNFGSSNINFFCAKRKLNRKKQICRLPPVHYVDYSTENDPTSGNKGWTGQVIKKPISDPRPELGKPICSSGPGRDPNEKKSPKKKDKRKTYLVCSKRLKDNKKRTVTQDGQFSDLLSKKSVEIAKSTVKNDASTCYDVKKEIPDSKGSTKEKTAEEEKDFAEKKKTLDLNSKSITKESVFDKGSASCTERKQEDVKLKTSSQKLSSTNSSSDPVLKTQKEVVSSNSVNKTPPKKDNKGIFKKICCKIFFNENKIKRKNKEYNENLYQVNKPKTEESGVYSKTCNNLQNLNKHSSGIKESEKSNLTTGESNLKNKVSNSLPQIQNNLSCSENVKPPDYSKNTESNKETQKIILESKNKIMSLHKVREIQLKAYDKPDYYLTCGKTLKETKDICVNTNKIECSKSKSVLSSCLEPQTTKAVKEETGKPKNPKIDCNEACKHLKDSHLKNKSIESIKVKADTKSQMKCNFMVKPCNSKTKNLLKEENKCSDKMTSCKDVMKEPKSTKSISSDVCTSVKDYATKKPPKEKCNFMVKPRNSKTKNLLKEENKCTDKMMSCKDVMKEPKSTESISKDICTSVKDYATKKSPKEKCIQTKESCLKATSSASTVTDCKELKKKSQNLNQSQICKKPNLKVNALAGNACDSENKISTKNRDKIIQKSSACKETTTQQSSKTDTLQCQKLDSEISEKLNCIAQENSLNKLEDLSKCNSYLGFKVHTPSSDTTKTKESSLKGSSSKTDKCLDLKTDKPKTLKKLKSSKKFTSSKTTLKEKKKEDTCSDGHNVKNKETAKMVCKSNQNENNTAPQEKTTKVEINCENLTSLSSPKGKPNECLKPLDKDNKQNSTNSCKQQKDCCQNFSDNNSIKKKEVCEVNSKTDVKSKDQKCRNNKKGLKNGLRNLEKLLCPTGKDKTKKISICKKIPKEKSNLKINTNSAPNSRFLKEPTSSVNVKEGKAKFPGPRKSKSSKLKTQSCKETPIESNSQANKKSKSSEKLCKHKKSSKEIRKSKAALLCSAKIPFGSDKVKAQAKFAKMDNKSSKMKIQPPKTELNEAKKNIHVKNTSKTIPSKPKRCKSLNISKSSKLESRALICSKSLENIKREQKSKESKNKIVLKRSKSKTTKKCPSTPNICKKSSSKLNSSSSKKSESKNKNTNSCALHTSTHFQNNLAMPKRSTLFDVKSFRNLKFVNENNDVPKLPLSQSDKNLGKKVYSPSIDSSSRTFNVNENEQSLQKKTKNSLMSHDQFDLLHGKKNTLPKKLKNKDCRSLSEPSLKGGHITLTNNLLKKTSETVLVTPKSLTVEKPMKKALGIDKIFYKHFEDKIKLHIRPNDKGKGICNNVQKHEVDKDKTPVLFGENQAYTNKLEHKIQFKNEASSPQEKRKKVSKEALSKPKSFTSIFKKLDLRPTTKLLSSHSNPKLSSDAVSLAKEYSKALELLTNKTGNNKKSKCFLLLKKSHENLNDKPLKNDKETQSVVRKKANCMKNIKNYNKIKEIKINTNITGSKQLIANKFSLGAKEATKSVHTTLSSPIKTILKPVKVSSFNLELQESKTRTTKPLGQHFVDKRLNKIYKRISKGQAIHPSKSKETDKTSGQADDVILKTTKPLEEQKMAALNVNLEISKICDLTGENQMENSALKDSLILDENRTNPKLQQNLVDTTSHNSLKNSNDSYLARVEATEESNKVLQEKVENIIKTSFTNVQPKSSKNLLMPFLVKSNSNVEKGTESTNSTAESSADLQAQKKKTLIK